MTEGSRQLRIDGGEVSTEETRPLGRGVSALTPVQRRILDVIRQEGSIRSVEAGVIMHRARGRNRCGWGAGADRYKGGGIACCGYASADGLSAMQRLYRRGLVKRGEKAGTWLAA